MGLMIAARYFEVCWKDFLCWYPASLETGGFVQKGVKAFGQSEMDVQDKGGLDE